jgi:hypothetical protein
MNDIVVHFKECPFGVVPLLHSGSELTILYSKVISAFIHVGYIADFVESKYESFSAQSVDFVAVEVMDDDCILHIKQSCNGTF